MVQIRLRAPLNLQTDNLYRCVFGPIRPNLVGFNDSRNGNKHLPRGRVGENPRKYVFWVSVFRPLTLSQNYQMLGRFLTPA